jgi:hypothetical protein
MIHPALKERAEILSSEQELTTWLQLKDQESARE